MSQFDFKRPDLRLSTPNGPSSSLISVVWCVACIIGALVATTVIGGTGGAILSLVAMIGVAVFGYAAGLYTAGWTPGRGDPS
jgi:hypothetical protein